jgi:hypothetical protein
MRLHPLPDHAEALSKVLGECERFLDAWEPRLERHRRIAGELREAQKDLDRGDVAGVNRLLRDDGLFQELYRRIRADGTARGAIPYLAWEYVDFTGMYEQRADLARRCEEFEAGAEPGHHDMNSKIDFMVIYHDFMDFVLERFRRLRSEVAAKYAEAIAGRPQRAREPRLSVNVAEETITLKGVVHHLKVEEATVIKILADAKGLWVTGREMKVASDLLTPRPDRIINQLPQVVRGYIQSGNAGYRLKWEELE